MLRDVRWIVGALAAALWIGPAAAQTGSTSQQQEKPYTTGSGVDSTRSNTDPSKAPGHESQSATTGTGSSATDSGSSTGTTGSANDRAVGGVGIGSGVDSTKSNSDPSKQPGYQSSTTQSATGASGSSSDTSTSGAKSSGSASSAEMAQTAAKLHAGNQAEIQAGQFMEQHAQNSKVKDFAKKMVKDHTSMDKDLTSFAQKQGIDLTSGSSAAATEKEKAQDQLSTLQGLSGAQADHHYMTMMVQDHQRDVSDVRSAEQQAKSSNENDFAKLLDKTAKKMESHLKDAQNIERNLTQRQARNPGQ